MSTYDKRRLRRQQNPDFAKERRERRAKSVFNNILRAPSKLDEELVEELDAIVAEVGDSVRFISGSARSTR